MKKTSIFMLLAALILTGCTQGAVDTTTDANEEARFTVKTMVLESGLSTKLQRYVGVVEPKDNIVLTSKVSGTVKEVLYEKGQTVKKDDIFLSLRDDEGTKKSVELNFALAQSSLETAKTNLENTKKANKSAVTTAESNVKSIDISINNLNKQIDDLNRGNNSQKESMQIAVESAQLQVNQLNKTIQDTISNNNLQLDVAENSVSTAEQGALSSSKTKENTSDLGDQSVEQAELYLDQLKDTLDELQDNPNATSAQIFEVELKIDAQKEAVKTAKLAAEANNDQAGSNATIQQIQLQAAREQFTQLQSSLTLQVNNLYNQLDLAGKQLEAAKQNLNNTDVQTDIQVNQLKNQITSLQEQKVIAQSTLESAKANTAQMLAQAELQLKQSQSNADSAKLTLDDFKITSTVDGVIEEVFVTEGETINPGQKLASVVMPDNYAIVVHIPWKEARMIDKKQNVPVFLGSDEYAGKIDFSSVTVDRTTQTVMYEIQSDLSKNTQFINSIVDVEIPFLLENNGTQLYIPLSSINVGSEKKSVFVVESNNQAKEVYIETGDIFGSSIEVLSGLEVGQKLVIQGQKSIRDGQFVNEVNEDAS